MEKKHNCTTRMLCLVLVLLCLPVFALAYEPVPDDILYVVNNPNPTDRLNLRTQPNESAPSLGRYYNGVRLGALSQPSNGWINVFVEGTSVTGYMQTQYLVYNPSTPVPSAIPLVTVNNKNGTGLTLREKPSSASTNVGLQPVRNGETVLVLGWGPDWCHVRIENLTAYVLTSGLAFDGADSSNNNNNNASITATACVRNPNPADRLNLRSEPRLDAISFGKYYNGTPVTVLADNSDGWVKVRIGGNVGGAEGYMQKQFLAFGDDCAKVRPAFPLYQATSSGWTLYNFPRVDQNESRTFGIENVEVLGIMENWWHVRIREHTGYVQANGLAIVNNPNSEDRLNLRERPQTSAVSLGKYYNGAVVMLLSNVQNGWVKVSIGFLEGYMESKYLAMNPWNDTVTIAIPTVTVKTSAGRLHLRESQSQNSESLGLYDNGTLVQFLGISATWCHVLVGGKAGFMMTEYLSPRLSF